MSEIAKIAEQFNTDLLKFFGELIEMCQSYKTLKKNGLVKDLKKYRSTIEVALQISQKKIIEQFIKTVLPMKKQIDKCDEDFFLGKNDNDEKTSLNQILKSAVTEKDKKDIDLDREIDKMREMYPYIKGVDRVDYDDDSAEIADVSAENDKKYIWQTLQYLCGVAGKYYQKLNL